MIKIITEDVNNSSDTYSPQTQAETCFDKKSSCV